MKIVMIKVNLHLEQFVEKWNSFGDKLLLILYEIYSRIISPILFIFVFSLVFLLAISILNNDYDLDFIIGITEFATIGSGTLAILTFTYALVKEKEDIYYNHITHAGELLFQATLTFIIGLGLFIGLRSMINNQPTVGNSLGVFSDAYKYLGIPVNLFILIIGMLSLMLSAYFLTSGIADLFYIFKKNLLKDKWN